MEFNKISFPVIEECFMLAESKEHIHAIFTAAATRQLDSEIQVIDADNLPGTLRSLPKQLKISNDKAMTLILSLQALIKEYIAVGMSDENVLAQKFPEGFKKSIKTFLFKMMREVAEDTKMYCQDEFSCLPKMKDFDWRLDIKTSTKNQERIKQPILYV
eukprot:CAMPEP_0176356138 /NCGR_PEP_ID=MMETSP0126-20121128/13799_1 /TAXON_ID=141414 ORGANISM="Strombidinopsis acuminatum, Strain SPMC142" /NCGR_SAMPLE_ID=MMETSP0126 /ASSEMBLY_ACC=CAM_ASM_000229 /LENGTH=158 /DNA_ID=CAMNT_0017709097 /DNA_START=18 /DNA_END=494 /DNA_ORIENTATION=-